MHSPSSFHNPSFPNALYEKKQKVTYEEICNYEKNTGNNFFNNIHNRFPEGISGKQYYTNVVCIIDTWRRRLLQATEDKKETCEEKVAYNSKIQDDLQRMHTIFESVFSQADAQILPSGQEYKENTYLHKKVFAYYQALLAAGFSPEEITR